MLSTIPKHWKEVCELICELGKKKDQIRSFYGLTYQNLLPDDSIEERFYSFFGKKKQRLWRRLVAGLEAFFSFLFFSCVRMIEDWWGRWSCRRKKWLKTEVEDVFFSVFSSRNRAVAFVGVYPSKSRVLLWLFENWSFRRTRIKKLDEERCGVACVGDVWSSFWRRNREDEEAEMPNRKCGFLYV